MSCGILDVERAHEMTVCYRAIPKYLPGVHTSVNAARMSACATGGANTRRHEDRKRVNFAYKIFTARAARRTTVASEIRACIIIISLAQRESTGTSVGEKAVLVLNARNR